MARESKEQRGFQLVTQLEPLQISWDLPAFDNAIFSSGTTLCHFRAMRCPIGVQDRNDIRHSAADHQNCSCSNGFIYIKAGVVTAFFQSNAAGPFALPEGLLESSSSMLTFPRFYDDTQERILVAPYDKLYLNDDETQVVTWELVEAHATGIDRTQYPVVCVEHLMDSRGITYQEGQDFVVQNGKIMWTGQNRPGTDLKLGRGVIYTIRYRYKPHWFIKDLIHDIRVMPTTDPVTMERNQERLPILVRVQREYIFLSAQRDDEGKNPGDSRSPESGGQLGPR